LRTGGARPGELLMFACICHAVPESVVVNAARSGASATEIAEATRAGTSCGLCLKALSALVTRSKICERTGAPCSGCDQGDDGP
jgi:bacterioferritin-associated ferredoxin